MCYVCVYRYLTSVTLRVGCMYSFICLDYDPTLRYPRSFLRKYTDTFLPLYDAFSRGTICWPMPWPMPWPLTWPLTWPLCLCVAVWHDIELKLLVWGGLNSLFMVVELVARHVWQLPSTRSLPPALLRLIASLAGATYILGITHTHSPSHTDHTNTLTQRIHSIHPLNTLSQHTLSTHPLNTSSEYTLSMHYLNVSPPPPSSVSGGQSGRICSGGRGRF